MYYDIKEDFLNNERVLIFENLCNILKNSNHDIVTVQDIQNLNSKIPIQTIKEVCGLIKLRVARHFNVPPKNFYLDEGTPSLRKYDSTSNYGPHVDQAHRQFTAVYYINDNYEGGEFYFSDTGVCIKPKANSLIIFNSKMKHGILPVDSGERFTMSWWYTFDLDMAWNL